MRILMEKYRDGQRELHCVFVDLEKAYDRVPREELWYCMRKSGVAEKYVRVVQDMYERSRTVVRCAVGQTEEIKVEVGLHQGSALSPFLFAIVMDQLSEELRQESPWTMMSADDIVICSESREQMEEILERWRFALERRGMKVSRSKTEYMCVNEREGSGTVRLQGEEVKKVQEFKYLGSTVQSNGECGKEHTDPDYSVAYVVIDTDTESFKGFGLTFTVGRGTEIVVCAVKALSALVIGKTLEEIVSDFRGFYRLLTNDGQMRWIGPEKGVIQLAVAAILNAIWDMWARAEGKPLWKLLVDMDPRQLIRCIDFTYITDALTEQEALDILEKANKGKQEREDQMLKEGYPAYTTSCAWLGYSDEQLTQLCSAALGEGWTRFKVKVGADLQDDIRRCRLIRNMIGPENTLMIDANQRWDVNEAISWVSSLAEFRPLWIEEPTSPDDILGHAAISKALAPLGIGVATGEQCHNRVMFKQFLQASALQFVQIDSCRVGSVNENLAIMLMAAKFKDPIRPVVSLKFFPFQVPVCPHAGGVGLCELVQHLILFDYISVSASLGNSKPKGIGGSVVGFSPTMQKAWVQFPANAQTPATGCSAGPKPGKMGGLRQEEHPA
ncbi:hypothetical protein QTP70_007697 [Hemibagrus guttatus]|uniref:Mitochondrial enolase superfamily member 1 n=1 Tax=Hemibagrus guttatus TaxID=175788 RepID=A0AAE0R760_9TELE|nr:hypothetical protein QTP70_007697 [Hemibagrus guttatus]